MKHLTTIAFWILTISLSAQYSYPYTLPAYLGPDNAIRPYVHEGKVCSLIKSFTPYTHFSLIEIDTATLQFDVTRIDSINTISPSVWWQAFELRSFDSPQRRIAYPLSQDSLFQVLHYSTANGVQSVDTVDAPIDLPWVIRAYSVQDSLYMFVGRNQTPPYYATQILLINKNTGNHALYSDILGMSYIDLGQEVSYVNGHLEWFNGMTQWYRVMPDLTIDTIPGTSPPGGYVNYRSAIEIGSDVYLVGDFVEFTYPTVAQYLPEHHIQVRSPNGNIVKMWFVENNTGAVENAGHAYDPQTESHYLSANILQISQTDPNQEIALSRISADLNQDTATSIWDINLGPEREYQNVGIAYANHHIFMLNRYKQGDTHIPQYEFRIFHESGSELSIEKLQLPSVTVLPNPVSDRLTVECEQLIEDIEIYDSGGKLVVNESVSCRNPVITTAQLGAGVYILECKFSNGNHRQKFIKY